MTRHVDHLLTAYVTGQLGPRRASRVIAHVRECADCRGRLAQHERLASDLGLVLGQNPVPRRAQIDRWWREIAQRPALQPKQPLATAVLPVIASLILLLVPLAAGRSIYPTHEPAHTFSMPQVDATLNPPATSISALPGQPASSLADSRSPEIATPVPSNELNAVTSVPLIPTAP